MQNARTKKASSYVSNHAEKLAKRGADAGGVVKKFKDLDEISDGFNIESTFDTNDRLSMPSVQHKVSQPRVGGIRQPPHEGYMPHHEYIPQQYHSQEEPVNVRVLDQPPLPYEYELKQNRTNGHISSSMPQAPNAALAPRNKYFDYSESCPDDSHEIIDQDSATDQIFFDPCDEKQNIIKDRQAVGIQPSRQTAAPPLPCDGATGSKKTDMEQIYFSKKPRPVQFK